MGWRGENLSPTDLHKVTAEPAVPCHRSLQIHLAPDSEFTWTFASSQLFRMASGAPS